MISIIAAVDLNNGIAKNKQIPWHIPSDLNRFRLLTYGNQVVMGRKTWDSIGKKSFVGRSTCILSSRYRREFDPAGNRTAVIFYTNRIDTFIRWSEKYQPRREIFIIGGGEVYKHALERDMVNRLYITEVQDDFNCDTFFPQYESDFQLVCQQDYCNKPNELPYHFKMLVK